METRTPSHGDVHLGHNAPQTAASGCSQAEDGSLEFHQTTWQPAAKKNHLLFCVVFSLCKADKLYLFIYFTKHQGKHIDCIYGWYQVEPPLQLICCSFSLNAKNVRFGNYMIYIFYLIHTWFVGQTLGNAFCILCCFFYIHSASVSFNMDDHHHNR